MNYLLQFTQLVRTASLYGLEIIERNISIFSIPNEMYNRDVECTFMQSFAYLKLYRLAFANHGSSLPADILGS